MDELENDRCRRALAILSGTAFEQQVFDGLSDAAFERQVFELRLKRWADSGMKHSWSVWIRFLEPAERFLLLLLFQCYKLSRYVLVVLDGALGYAYYRVKGVPHSLMVGGVKGEQPPTDFGVKRSECGIGLQCGSESVPKAATRPTEDSAGNSVLG